MEQNDENNEYNEFWVKFAKNAREVMQEYNKLSPANKQQVYMDAWNILVARGIVGLREYLNNFL